jgi:hypothetical protein
MPVAIPFDIGAPRFADEFMTFEFSTRSRWLLAAIAPQRVAHSVSSAIRRSRRMIPGRHSPSSNFPTSVSIAIDPGDQTPHCLVADRDMQSARQMSAADFSRRCSKERTMRSMNPFSFDVEQVEHAIHGEHSVKRWGSDHKYSACSRQVLEQTALQSHLDPAARAAASIDRGGACGRCN